MIRERKSFQRYGVSYIPMDETLSRAVVDISGRPYLSFNATLSKEKVGTFDSELVEEFFRALINQCTFNYILIHLEAAIRIMKLKPYLNHLPVH